MDKPTRYWIGYEDKNLWARELERAKGDQDAIDPTDVWATEDAKTLAAAKKLARQREVTHDVTVTVYERYDFVAAHPFPEYPAYTDWDWKDQPIGDITCGRWTQY